MRWGLDFLFASGLPAKTLVLRIALVAIALGLVAGVVQGIRRSPLETARALARQGSYAEAEHLYVDLASKSPGDLPLLLELLDNHEHLEPSEEAPATPPADGDAPFAPLLAQAPPDAALLAAYWLRVLRNAVSDPERARVVRAADRTPPVPWANEVLGREALRAGDRAGAAKRFAREAKDNGGREAEARLACDLWGALGDWRSVDSALAYPGFDRQLAPTDRLELATRRGDWLQTLRWAVPADVERATVGIVLLATLSAAIWFAILARIASPMTGAHGARVHVAAFVLGVMSAYATLGLFASEVRVFPALGSRDFGPEMLDCLFGVGPREEIAKAVLALPVLFWVKRHGRRRDALACGGLVGLGFATVENVGYFEEGLSTALARFVSANLLHIATTGLVAAAIDDTLRRRATKGNGVGWTLAFVAVLHGFYDAVLVAARETGVWKLGIASLLFFWLVVRSFLSAVREALGRDPWLEDAIVVGTALVTGATFVYASALEGSREAALAVIESLGATILIVGAVASELGRSASR